MNNAKRVLLFTILACTFLSVFSFFPPIKTPAYIIKKIDLFSDIRKEKTQADAAENDSPQTVSAKKEEKKEPKVFEHYLIPAQIVSFSNNASKPALENFVAKLVKLKKEKRGKVRIAFMGDSMIEGDLLTQDFRLALQHEFGGNGVGFVPVTDIAASIRTTANSKYSNDWAKRNYKSDNTNGLFISGNVFNSGGASWLSVSDNTTPDSLQNAVQINLLYGKGKGTVVCNDASVVLDDNALFNVQHLAHGKSVSLKVSDQSIPLFGTSFESENGVIVDNFSFRGISGIEIKKLDDGLLSQINDKRPYDLIVLEYGINVLFRPNDTNFDWYYKMMLPSIQKIKKCFPNADILMLSSGDRAFRYGGEWASAKGVSELVKTQATMAMDENICFFNLFETMGGENSIVAWANSTPALANKDYVHPNHNGAKKLAGILFDAVMHEVHKASN